MGNLFYYRKPENDLGDLSKGRWRQVRKILPHMIDYINESMQEKWNEGTIRNVSIPGPNFQAKADIPPKKFLLCDRIFADLSEVQDEVCIIDSRAIKTIFEWSDFLLKRDGAFKLYVPTLEAFKQATYGIENYWNEA